MYIHCMTVYIMCIYNVHTVYIHKQTCTCDCCFEFILVQTMCIPCTGMACTISRFYEHVYPEIKKMLSFKIQTHDLVHTRKLPWPLRYQRDCSERIVALYVSCFTWRLVTYVRRRTSSAPRPAMNSQASGSTWAQIALKPRQPCRRHCSPWQALGTPGPFPGCSKQTLLTEHCGSSHGGPSARAGPSWGHNKTICAGLYLN